MAWRDLLPWARAARATTKNLISIGETPVRPIIREEEFGVSGTENFGGYIRREDFNPELDDFQRAVLIYEKMRRTDAQIRAMLQVIKLPLRGATWTVVPPPGGDPVDKEIADFVNGALFDDDAMDTSWDYCADAETEILTKDGWKRHEALLVGEQVLTLNPQTIQAEWQPVQAVNRFPGVRPMRHLVTRAHDSLTTAPHRWFVRQTGTSAGDYGWTTTQHLKKHHAILRAAPVAGLPTEPTFTDAFVELVGWFTTEGCWEGRGGAVYQTKPDGRKQIESCLGRLCDASVDSLHDVPRGGANDWQAERVAWSVSLKEERHARYALNTVLADQLRAVCDPQKAVSKEFVFALTRDQLTVFLDAAVAGDGEARETGLRTIGQAVTSRLDAIEMAAILIGLSVHRRTSTQPTGEPFYWLSISDRHSHQVLHAVQSGQLRGNGEVKDEWVVYKGTVWCPTTQNSTWFARRNGKSYFTGNTLRHILMQLDFGFSVLEKVWTVDDQGFYRLKKLAPRLPKTIREWHTHRDGRLRAVVQYAPVPVSTERAPTGIQRTPTYQTSVSYQYLTIPAEYLLVCSLEREGDNYEGWSVLRTVYRNWWFKDQAYHIEGVGLDRWGVGIPVAELEEGHNLSTDELDLLRDVLKAIRSNEKAYLVAPPHVKFKILPEGGSAGAGGARAQRWIDHHDSQMARNVLAGFLTMGQDTHGTLGFGSRLTDMFISSLGGVAKGIAGDLKHQVVKPLCNFNFDMTRRQYPSPVAQDLENVDLGNIITAMADLAGVVITPQDDDESLLRKMMGMPPLDPAFSRKRKMEELKAQAAVAATAAATVAEPPPAPGAPPVAPAPGAPPTPVPAALS